jgi:hypothetical protein
MMNVMKTRGNFCSFMLCPMKTGLYALFIGSLFMSISAFTARAQSDHILDRTAQPVVDTIAVSKLVRMIKSPIDAQRDSALHHVGDLTRRAPEVDLSFVVPALVATYKNDPNEKYRLAAVATLHLIGDETGMEQVRERFIQEPSLVVQYVSVCILIDYYGPTAFGSDREAVSLARNVLARKHEAQRLANSRHALVIPRVIVGPLEVVESDSSQ